MMVLLLKLGVTWTLLTNIAWSKKRSVSTQLRRRAGMWVTDEYGNKIEVGYKSEIIGVTFER